MVLTVRENELKRDSRQFGISIWPQRTLLHKAHIQNLTECNVNVSYLVRWLKADRDGSYVKGKEVSVWVTVYKIVCYVLYSLIFFIWISTLFRSFIAIALCECIWIARRNKIGKINIEWVNYISICWSVPIFLYQAVLCNSMLATFRLIF